MSPATVTLEQVASVAGVSRATVSRVVNGSPRVSDAARTAVQDAIVELGYEPNRAARSLASRRSHAVGLVVAESETRLFVEPFFGALVRGASEALSDGGVPLVLSFVRRDQTPEATVRYLSAHVDGVLLVSAHAEDPVLARLERERVPTILAGRPTSPTGVAYVDADNAGGARLAVQHLLDRGRGRIATIAGPQDLAAGRDRLSAYHGTLNDAGVAPDAELVAEGDFSAGSAITATEGLLARAPDLDAIFAASDVMAVAAIGVLERAGRRVPDDVAVVGFDDSPLAPAARPPLTSVHQPVEAIGRAMVERLAQALAGEDVVRATVLPTRLVVRDSG